MNRTGYTLLEILIVILLIGILAAGMVSVHKGVRTMARRAATIALLKRIEVACERYRVDFRALPLIRDLPATTDDESTTTTIDDLIAFLQENGKTRYLDLSQWRPEDDTELRGRSLVDSWGETIALHVKDRGRFFLVSGGPDRRVNLPSADAVIEELARRRNGLSDAATQRLACDDLIAEVR